MECILRPLHVQCNIHLIIYFRNIIFSPAFKTHLQATAGVFMGKFKFGRISKKFRGD